MGQGTDSKLAAFISELAPNSLRAFVTHSDTGIGHESFLALSGHGRSLKQLKLCLHSDALPAIAYLKGCTELETLDLEDLHGTIDMEKTQNDVFLETIAWLRECKSLREVSFKKFQSAPALMVPILLEDRIRLEKVEIESSSYALKDSSGFHMALANQKSIQSLGLQADGEDAWGVPVSTFIDSLGKMTELRELRLNIYNCESIGDPQISALATALENLEGFYINTGWNYTDAVLGPVAKLKQLRNITFGAFSRFTTDGLLEFVAQLGPGNQGMVLTVDAADPDAGLSDDEQNLVREALNVKVGGEFGYQFWRDPDVSEFEGESD
ncbi:hypothetical protein LTS18_012253 [Coniosporium uncinatum]|uniref:Uncharacterized protein n=1 Tax=Coniosporium uncinatum TaxID=93489 RepID=A0ACC3DJJ1_9PEZI|nr:hypothetical protein LTS18_012253 [Coniosporium uncinatum]